MGLFDIFKRTNQDSDGGNGQGNKISQLKPENLKGLKDNIPSINSLVNGIEQIYTFLQADYESKGYNDALVNPDDSYKTDNIKLIKLDLQILVDKTSSYYDNLISELNLHIVTRSRAGLVDLVQELESRKNLIEEYKRKLQSISESIHNENGLCQRIILSYQRGFMRGLSALTQSSILNKKI
jgi:hypothetical protein